ncbi:MAG: leucyl aminopeptidase [Negativicutes bacterium]|nr:leucyl aminopeptidase [Negativicutes bacterium]
MKFTLSKNFPAKPGKLWLIIDEKRNLPEWVGRTGWGIRLASRLAGEKSLGQYGMMDSFSLTSEQGEEVSGLLTGAGAAEEFTVERLRRLTGEIVRQANKRGYEKIWLIGGGIEKTLTDEQVVEAVVTGATLGGYTFDYYRTGNTEPATLGQIGLFLPGSRSAAPLSRLAGKAQTVADAVNYCRDLVNHPANHMNAAAMRSEAEKLGQHPEITVSILDEDCLHEMGAGGILAVGRASVNRPLMIVIEYRGKPRSAKVLALAGKAVTFDSGGLCIKTTDGMLNMKNDMAGGAAVLATVRALAANSVPVNVRAAIPVVENMIDGTAYRPGDVLKMMSGKTVQIVSTDAEGRLILADALHFLSRSGPAAMIDVATLTGACAVALGDGCAALIGNDDDLCKQLTECGREVGENFWQLPMFDDYRELLKGEIADLKNSGGRHAGTILGGMFLSEFVNGIPWVHIDIASTDDVGKTAGYQIRGATGMAVRTLYRFAVQFCR